MSESSEQTDEELVKDFERLQSELTQKLIIEDTEEWAQNINGLELIGGIDISYDKRDDSRGCVTCVVLNARNHFEIVYKNNSIIRISNRYIAGFLAFREIEFLVKQFEILRQNCPKFLPQVWLIDGNGIQKIQIFCLFLLFIFPPIFRTITSAEVWVGLTFWSSNRQSCHRSG